MILLTTSRFFTRLRFLFPVLILFLASAKPAHAQGCNGVPTNKPDNVTWTPQWCQEFNATVPGPPDPMVWTFDLGNSGFGNHEIETYCGPPGFPGNPAQSGRQDSVCSRSNKPVQSESAPGKGVGAGNGFFGAPAVGHLVQDNLNQLGVGTRDPGHTLAIDFDPGSDDAWHR